MISKYLETRVSLNPNNAIDAEYGIRQPMDLEYYLLENENNTYGIEVVKREVVSNYETEMIKNFSGCREATRNTVGMLAANRVTPMELMFVLDNMVGV